MLERIIVNAAIAIITKLVGFLATKITELVEYLSDESRRKQAVKEAESGNNASLEHMLRNPPK